MMADSMIKKLALAGVLLAIVVVVLGAFTRLVDAGLGCPDWPGCYGHVLWPETADEIRKADSLFPGAPVDVDKTWPEMVHRYFAGALLLLVLGITVSSRINRHRLADEKLPNLAVALLVLILCQAAFGAWTVTLKLWPQVVTAHLLGGFATLSMLWVIYLRAGGGEALKFSSQGHDAIRTLARFGLAIVITQVALGGWVSSNYAALACADFPACFGSFNPDMDLAAGFNLFQGLGPNYLGGLLDNDARVAIHWSHRLGALVVLVVVAWLAIRLFAFNRALAGLLLGVLALQLLLGSLNVLWALPLKIATLHNACGALLLLCVITVNFAPPKTSEIPT